MVDDLKIIKKKYGEEMMHYCRRYFSTILDTPSVLSKIMLNNFNPSRELYKDIKNNDLEMEFKNYIYKTYYLSFTKTTPPYTNKTPFELLRDENYTLYECQTEDEIQQFKKYYAPKEEICTFRGGRLETDYVFFAIKDNAQTLKREEFIHPLRQDEYGTSVISIQFTKDDVHILSIKNRYNLTVPNPDSTFNNNLDNIVLGLTDSFKNYYGLNQTWINTDFEIPGYIKASDGMYYKYNYKINDIYYCADNVIIDRNLVKKFPKERFIVLDYYILDMNSKEIRLFDSAIVDSFPKTVGKIDKITIKTNTNTYKEITISVRDGNDIIINIDKNNNIIAYLNDNVTNIDTGFMKYNTSLSILEIPNVEVIHSYFLLNNEYLSELNLPNTRIIENKCLVENKIISTFNALKIKKIGNYVLMNNLLLTEINLPNIEQIGTCFLKNNHQHPLKIIKGAHNLEKIGTRKLSIKEREELFGNNDYKNKGGKKI